MAGSADLQHVPDFLEHAHHFTCTIFAAGAYRTNRFRTLMEARAYAPEMERRAANGRKALIYCVTLDGNTHFVTEDIPS